MKEESRIEALEHELKILKNEIQSTLLEIREQILNHYYPELRAEEPLRNLSLPVRPQVGRPGVPPKVAPRSPESPSTTLSEIEAKGQIQPFSDIFLDDLEEDGLDDTGDEIDELVNSRRPSALNLDEDADEDYEDDFVEDDADVEDGEDDSSDDTASIGGIKVQKVSAAPAARFGVTPQTREVDFRQLKQAAANSAPTNSTANAAPQAKPVETPEKAEAQAPRANRQAFAALAAWVSDGVEKVGKARTTQIVETYAAGGKLPAETKASLLQLVALADDVEANGGTQEMLSLMVALDTILSGK